MASTARSSAPLLLLVAGAATIAAVAWWAIGSGASDDRIELAGRAPIEPTEAPDAAPSARAPEADRGELAPTRRTAPQPPPLPLAIAAARRLELRGRADFHGVVRDPAGVPVLGAQLFHRGERVGKSGAGGWYRIEVAHDVATRAQASKREVEPLLAAFAPGIGVACTLLWGPSRRLDLTLEPGGTLTGRVVERESGAPVGGAAVDLLARPDFARDAQIAFAESTTSDGNGRFELGHLPAGSFELRGRAPGHDSNGFHSFAFDGTRQELELLISPTARVTGWFEPWPPPARDASAARALADGAEVRAWSGAAPGRWFDARSLATKVDEQGRFELELPQDCAVDLALVSGQGLLWADGVEIEGDAPEVSFGRIRLTDGGMLTGRVALPPEVLELGLRIEGMLETEWGATTFERELPADGRIALGPLPPGIVRLQVTLAGKPVVALGLRGDGSPSGEGVDLRSGETSDLGELAPRHAVFLAGRVVDESGSPCAKAQVALAFEGDREETIADAQGRYVLDVTNLEIPSAARDDLERALAGRLQIAAWTRGRAPRLTTAPVPPARSVLRHDVVLAAGAALRGVLADASGAPCVGHALHVCSGARDVAAIPCDAFDVTSADGSFELLGLAPGTFELRIVAPDGACSYFREPIVLGAGGASLRLSLADATAIPWHATAAR